MRLAGHCFQHKEEEASKLLMWQPDRGRANRGRRRTTYIDTLLDDTGCTPTQEFLLIRLYCNYVTILCLNTSIKVINSLIS